MKNSLLVVFFIGILFSCKSQTDYALLENRGDWFQHFSFGSPSWDNFKRFSNNPIYSGREGMEWPVNGFFFSDSASKAWYIYVGEYQRNYGIDNKSERKQFNCKILRSMDKGNTWDTIGDAFENTINYYDTMKIEIPDVQVVYHQGKYHMIFDWLAKSSNWGNMINNRNSGLGYAVADKPEGPFKISREPVKINHKATEFINDKYWRTYAPMIVKQKNNWGLYFMMDMPQGCSWVLASSFADKPEGPYSQTKLVLGVENKKFYQPLMEYYPSFNYAGYTYFPATSVALNRNYQSIHRVKTGEMEDFSKWKVYKSGSVWHPENVSNEYAGIWGQTFSGFVENDTLYTMYPSRTKENYGTINLAKCSWKNMENLKGFHFGANAGKSFSFIKKIIDVEEISVEMKISGNAKIVWDYNATIMSNVVRADCTLDSAMFSNHKEIELENDNWKMNIVDENSNQRLIASGKFSNTAAIAAIKLKKDNTEYVLEINNKEVWRGTLMSKPGVAGIILNQQSFVEVNKFIIKGKQSRGTYTLGYHEALLGAGTSADNWRYIKSNDFTSGKGVVSKSSNEHVKWNFDGEGFELYCPKSSEYGNITLYLDGIKIKEISLKGADGEKSNKVFELGGLKKGSHTLFIEAINCKMPVDCIKIKI